MTEGNSCVMHYLKYTKHESFLSMERWLKVKSHFMSFVERDVAEKRLSQSLFDLE